MEIDSIEWHEGNLANQKDYLMRLIIERDQLTDRILDMEQRVNLRQRQIDMAKKEGKQKFDSMKYLVKRGK